MLIKTPALAALLLTVATAVHAGSWTLDGDASALGFVSTKNGEVAEAHSFSGLSGSVSEGGAAEITIPLASVETLIDIRNERMREFLFKVADYPAAKVTATVPLDDFAALAAGERMTSLIEVTVSTNGAEASYEADVNVTRLADNKVAVSTARPMITDARDFAYEDGLSKLQEIAGLDSISPAVPVTFDLVFSK